VQPLAPGHWDASSVTVGVDVGPARGGFFLVECEQFALQLRPTALGRKSVPIVAVLGSDCLANAFERMMCERMIYGGL